MTEPLRGKLIWLTRPAGTAGDMGSRFEQLGARVLNAPVLEIRALPAGHPALAAAAELAGGLGNYRHVLFISGNAVNHGMPLLKRQCPVWPPYTRVYAIGKSTARLLEKHGLEVLQPAAARMNSEGLLELPQLQSIAADKVLIVRGIGGREHLARALRDRGAGVDYLEAYQRVKSGTLADEINRQLGAGSVDYIVAASGETVTSIVDLVDRSIQGQLKAVAIVVPGARVAEIARRAGFRRVVETLNAGEDTMVGAVLEATLEQG